MEPYVIAERRAGARIWHIPAADGHTPLCGARLGSAVERRYLPSAVAPADETCGRCLVIYRQAEAEKRAR